MGGKFKPIRNRQEGFARSKKCHFCLDCRHRQAKTYKECPICGSDKRQYFMSERERKRGEVLLNMRDGGIISDLKFQPRYNLIVNGEKICAYVGDAEYVLDGVTIHEDTKPNNWIDPMSKLKIKLFEALYGVTVTIPDRASKTIK